MAKKPKAENRTAKQKPRWFKKFLGNTFHHYSASLAGKYGFFWRIVFAFLFKHVEISNVDARHILDISKRGTIIYVIRNRSRLEYLLLHYLFRKKGLPAPEFSHYISVYLWQPIIQTLRRVLARLLAIVQRQGYLNPYQSGYVEKLIVNGEPSLLPARHFHGLPWRFGSSDPFADIIRIQHRTRTPVYLVPIEFAYGRRPDREFTKITDLLWGTKVTPGAFRQVMMFLRNRKQTTIMVADPLLLEQEVEEAMILIPKTPMLYHEIAYNIRTTCIERINRERRVILGPVLKSRSEVIEDILHENDVFNFLQEHAKNDVKDFISLRRDARKMLEEIAADYSPSTVKIVTVILRWVFHKLYANMEINLDQLDQVRAMAREMPVVYIPCHKSHLDYLILSYLLYQHNMSLPYIVSGVNLNFWPLGAIFRGGGAFFMRRTFKGKRLYSKVFTKYVEYLVRESIPIEFFIEGTRSRTGKIVLPRLGFISILLNAVRATGKKNLCIVPVSINYEHIFEKSFYLNEAKGKKTEGENIGTMIRNRKMVKQKLGRMYLEIAQPFTLQDLLRQNQGRLPTTKEKVFELGSNMAYRIANAINNYTIATPFSIVSAVLLAESKKGILLKDVKFGVKMLYSYLKIKGVTIVGDGPNWIEGVIDWTEKEKILSSEADDEENMAEEDKFYFLDEENRMDLTFYKNTICHHYAFASLLSSCFLAAGEPVTKEVLFNNFTFLKKTMGGEIIFSDTQAQDDKFDNEVFNTSMEFFTGHGYVRKGEAKTLTLNKDGKRAAKIFAGSILDFVSCYYILAKTLRKNRKTELIEREWVKKGMKMGKRMFSIGEIRRSESIHKNILESGLKHFEVTGICELDDRIDEKSKRTRSYKVIDFEKLDNILARLKPFAEL